MTQARPGSARTRQRAVALCKPSLLVCLPLLLIVLVHMGLVGLGQWQGDDYDYAAGLRDHGVAFAWHRLTTDTPRPFSETLLFFYAAAIDRLHRPLIGTFLSLCWAILLLGCGGRLILRPQGRLVPRLLLALSLASLFLLGHPLADMLYWPVGAAAYAPTVAALCFLLIHILDDSLGTAAGRAIAAAALVVAVTSSEMGAFVSLGFTAAMLLAQVKRPCQPVAWLLVPLILSLCVFAVTALNGRAAGAPTLASPTGHHLLASLRAAVPQTLRAMGMIDRNDGDWGQQGAGSLALGIPLKLLLLAGFLLTAHRCFGRIPRWPLIALILALLFGMFASLFAADYQFGFQCCQRHKAVRQCFMVLVLLASACLVAPAPRDARGRVVAGLLCLTLAIARVAVWRLPDLVAAYRSTQAAEISLRETWQSGLAAGPTAIVRQRPATLLTHAWTFPLGQHWFSPTQPYDIRSIMQFFKDDEVTVLPSLHPLR